MDAETHAFIQNATRSRWTLCWHIIFSVGILMLSFVIATMIGRGRGLENVQRNNDVLPLVKTETAILEEDGITFQVDGVVIPFREVAISSEVSGRVTLLSSNCRTGRYVKKGEMLAEIDKTDYQHALDEAKQNLVIAEREISEWQIARQNIATRIQVAIEQCETQKKEYERCEKLYHRGAVSESDKENAKLNLLAKEEAIITHINEQKKLNAQRERLFANQAVRQIEVEKAELNLIRCTISAPITGLVVSLNAEEDKFVQRGETLVTIHDTSRLEVQCSLYMKQVEWLWSEQHGITRNENDTLEHFYQFADTPVKLLYELNGTTYQWQGMLTYLDGPGLDSRTRMMPCRVMVEKPLDVQALSENKKVQKDTLGPTLMPGMFVKVEVHTTPARKLLNLSETAILPGGTVWKVKKNADGKNVLTRASKIVIAHFDTVKSRVLVYEKPGILEAGEEVVISPLASPANGTFVEVLDPEVTQ